MTQPQRTFAFVGTYIPRKCGIATFTAQLCDAIRAACSDADLIVLAVNDSKKGYAYPREVCYTLDEQDIDSYRNAAQFINLRAVDVVCLQHEYGIFGGWAGSHILTFLRELTVPIVTTLHTVLTTPDIYQHDTLCEIARLSSALVVMSDRASQYLRTIYSIPEEKIRVVPHGVFVAPSVANDQQLQNESRVAQPMLMSYGLLSPNKGVEDVIEALPAILDRHGGATYHVVGVTHPTVKRQVGEGYRRKLQRLASEHGVSRQVLFVNQYLSSEQLQAYFQSATLCLTTYLNVSHVVSGTVASMMGAGKAIISTPFWYAEDLLGDDCGALVPFHDPPAIADAVCSLLDDDTQRASLSARAWAKSQSMRWSHVAQVYVSLFEHLPERQQLIAQTSASVQSPATPVTPVTPVPLPEIDLRHVRRLTDETGLLEHAFFTTPRYQSGYSTDDNARALMLCARLAAAKTGPCDEASHLAHRYLAFLNYAFDEHNHRFHNRLSYTRQWLDDQGSEDSQGRALQALGALIGRTQDATLLNPAMLLLHKALHAAASFRFPRPRAYAILGLHHYLRRFPGDVMARRVERKLTDLLSQAFKRQHATHWPWCENALTYDNAVLPHALIVGGADSGRDDIVDRGLRALTWLVDVQHAGASHFVPIGCNGFYAKDGPRARYDQQPIEAHATIAACLAAYSVSQRELWHDEALRTFGWFFGQNDLSLPLYDPDSGGCCDGLQPDRINQNQGAESTLAFLLSLSYLATNVAL